ncbi:hypothetical protein V8F20_010219 [Naviculisporaceae sp. PSN 640]
MKGVVFIFCLLCEASAFSPRALLNQARQKIPRTSIWDHVQPFHEAPSNFNIPLFILDTKHPWIIQNKDLLNSLPDTEGALCSNNLNHPALFKLRQRYPLLTPPPDLFDTIYIGHLHQSRPGYHNMIHRLQELLSCPAALRNVKSLEVVLALDMAESAGASYNQTFGIDIGKLNTSNPRDYSWFQTNLSDRNSMLWAKVKLSEDEAKFRGDYPFANMSLEEFKAFYNVPPPPFELSTLLAQVLSPINTPNLTSLAWDMPCQISQHIERDLHMNRVGHGLMTLPNIKHLQLGEYVEYMLYLTPSLESLTIGNVKGDWGGLSENCLWFYRLDGPPPETRLLWALQYTLANSPRLKNTLTQFKYLFGGYKLDINNFFEFLTNLPNLKSLTHIGPVHLPLYRSPKNLPPYCNPEEPIPPSSPLTQPFRNYLRNIASRLPHLTSFNLPRTDYLSLTIHGHDPTQDPRCPDVYKKWPSRIGSPAWRNLNRFGRDSLQWANKVDLATKLILEEIPTLKEFTIDRVKPPLFNTTRLVRNDDVSRHGLVFQDVIWPWTGRFHQWADWAGKEEYKWMETITTQG